MVHHNHFPAKTTKEPLQPPAHWLVAPQGHENPTRCHRINSRTGLYARTYAACLQSYSNTLALLLDRNASQPMLFNLMLELFIAVKQSKEPTSRSPERICRFAGKKKTEIDVQMHSMTCGAAVPRPALDTGTPAAGPRELAELALKSSIDFRHDFFPRVTVYSTRYVPKPHITIH